MSVATDPKDCPYVGLDPFEPAYERYFFGREQDSRVIADHVASRPITVLYGPSGVGKTSVLNVGLPAALSRRRPWLIATLREWQNPAALEERAIEAVQAALPDGTQTRQGSGGFARQLVHALHTTAWPMLLILDQFEEYFLYSAGTALGALEQALSALVNRQNLDLHVLVSLRDDSLFRLDRLRAVVPGIMDTTIRLGHLDDASADQAIRCPILRYNEEFGTKIAVEDALVERLKKDLRSGGQRAAADTLLEQNAGPIELPYLQLVLTKLWAAEGGSKSTALQLRTLTETLGGVRDIADQHVNRILSVLTPREQALCADIFRYLVTSSGSKIAYPTDDLAKRISEDRKETMENDTESEVRPDEVRSVLRKLTPAETRVLKPVKVGGEDAFELFHDVLGKPLSAWRRTFNANMRLRAELREATRVRQARRRRNAMKWTAISAVAVTSVLLGVAFVTRVREMAGRGEWNNLAFSHAALAHSEIDTLRRIQGLGAHARDGFLAPLTGQYFARQVPIAGAAGADPVIVEKFAHRPEAVLRSLGLNPLTNAESQAAIATMIRQLQMARSRTDIGALTQGLLVLAANRTASQDQSSLPAILTALTQRAARTELGAGLASGPSARALRDISPGLNDAQAQAVIEPLIEAIEASTDADITRNLGQAMQTACAKLSGVEAVNETSPVLTSLGYLSGPDNLGKLQLVSVCFRRLLENNDAFGQAALGTLLNEVDAIDNSFAIRSFAQVVWAFPTRLTEAQMQPVIEHILALMSHDKDIDDLGTLADALVALPAKLSSAQLKTATSLLFAEAKRTGLPQRYYEIAAELDADGSVAPDAEAQSFLSPMLQSMRSKDIRNKVRGAEDLAASVPILSPAAAKTAMEAILPTSGETYAAPFGPPLGRALSQLAARLTESQAQPELGMLIANLNTSTDPGAISLLAGVLQALAPKLTSAQAENALKASLAKITPQTAPGELDALAQAAWALVPDLSNNQAQASLAGIRATLEIAGNPAARRELAHGVRLLAPKLTDQQAADLFPDSCRQLAVAGDEESADAWAGAGAALAAHDKRDSDFRDAVVVMLKYPTAAGKPTDTLMNALRQRFPNAKELQGSLYNALPWLGTQLPAPAPR